MRSWSQRKALPKLSAIAVLVGIASGLVILLFRILTEHAISGLMPSQNHEGFEHLSADVRFFLPVFGALILAVIYRLVPKEHHDVGVPYLLQRLDYHQGHLPFKNTLMQFIGATIALISGQSAGREGPAIHMGGGVSSFIARYSKLPYAYRRMLIASGIAAAISASFNTPLAGVIFAQEVVLRQYSLISMTPLAIAAVSGSLVTQLALGELAIFPSFEIILNLWDFPGLVLLGIFIGGLSVVFNRLLIAWQNTNKLPKWYSLPIAGLITGAVAYYVPEVMGVGYDTINLLLGSVSDWQWVVIILCAKLLLTSFVLAYGVPGGLIGPNLLMGACAGFIVGLTLQNIQPDINPGLFCLIGMASMMGASLHAPIAALITLLEMTNSSQIILPGMISIVMAYLINKGLCGQQAIFDALQKIRHDRDRMNAQSHTLEQFGIMPIMDRRFVVAEQVMNTKNVIQLLYSQPRWVVIDSSTRYYLMQASDLANWLQYQLSSPENIERIKDDAALETDLLSIPASRLELTAINIKADIGEALSLIDSHKTDALLIQSTPPEGQAPKLLGIITQNDLDHFYSNRKFDEFFEAPEQGNGR
ncbi:chloride channel protein [Litoribrevibacter albus]|uniref:Chloride channel protein n=1 Tax=Litoribrevibacter albus TaxID=1473156 RepID=A0AA37SDR2_9GAMM|nr:chloride channel protein [Litoribrevibacter albus]GLQ33170.1 chloride channel protein [Litoribrevibacter albus]